MQNSDIKGQPREVRGRESRHFTFDEADTDRPARETAQPAPTQTPEAYHTPLGYTAVVPASPARLDQTACEAIPEHAVTDLATARLVPPAPARLPPARSVDCGVWRPYRVERAPSEQHSPELMPFTRGTWNTAHTQEVPGVAMVRQSEGRTSCDRPLVSIKFDLCTAFIFRNAASGETLLVHHDSGARSTWPEEERGTLGPPVEPATPNHGILHRDRICYDDFMSRKGHKQVIQVDGDGAYDRRELAFAFREAGIEVLAPLKMMTEPIEVDFKMAEWHLCYRPLVDELLIQLTNVSRPHLMHFRQVFARPPAPADRAPGYVPDFVDRLDEHRERVRTGAGTSARTRDILGLCLAIVDLRNVNYQLAQDRFLELRGKCEHLFPDELLRRLRTRGGVNMRDPLVTRTLTLVANILIKVDREEREASDFVDRLHEHRERVRTGADISARTRDILGLCLAIVDLRNVNDQLAQDQFLNLREKCTHLFPDELLDRLQTQGGVDMCDPLVTRTLTVVANILIKVDREEREASG